MNKFTPMLAHKTDMSRVDFKSKRYFMQPKLDGIRCYITEKGMFTRNHKPIVSCPHIIESLKPFFKKFGSSIILDGELYNHTLKHNFEKIVSLVRKTKPTQEALWESAGMVEFHCYDLYLPSFPEMRFEERTDFIIQTLIDKYKPDGVVAVYTCIVENEKEIEIEDTANLEVGYEGSMLRSDSPYETKRSWTLQKVKKFMDAEFKIVDAVEGNQGKTGKMVGKLGKFIMQDSEGREFGAPAGKGWNLAKLEEIWNNKENYIGKMATIEFFEYTTKGVPRFPKFKHLRNYE